MIAHDEIDDARAAMINRRIGQAFAFARVAVGDPDVMDIFENGSDLDIKEIVPNPHIPGHAFSVEGKSPAGEPITVAVGVCDCNPLRDLASGRLWLRVGERWVCAECRRVYAFDGERITVTEGADAMIG